jgi:predicted acetyltransferase
MAVEILNASIDDKSLLQKMMELYQHDLSEFTKTNLDKHGYFGYSYLDNYWAEPSRYPFLVRVDGQLAGFVLVNQFTCLPASQYSLAEFFILRKYRKYGIGRKVAVYIFDLFCGHWEIYQPHANVIAKKFWKSVIGTYTEGLYTETVMEDNGWAGIIRSFNNKPKQDT